MCPEPPSEFEPLPALFPTPAAVEDQLAERFAAIDRGTGALSQTTGMVCPPGCGACCHSPEVEATTVEFAALARRLLATGRIHAVRARLAERQAANDPRCALFAPEVGSTAQGRCTEYEDRPILCRLFAFSARSSRIGLPELVVCRTLRVADPEAVARAQAHVRSGGEVEFMAHHAQAIAGLDPGAGGAPQPINVALAAALQRAELAAYYAALEGVEDLPEGTPPRDAPRPAA